MRRILQSTLALTLALAMGDLAEANNKGTHSPRTSPSAGARTGRGTPQRDRGVARDYHRGHGKKFSHGIYYPGRNHRHWTHRYWNRGHRCYYYYCPYVRCYYYWCGAKSCYYPVSYITMAPPDGGDFDDGPGFVEEV